MNSCCLWANRYMKLSNPHIKAIFWFKKSFESSLKLFLAKFCQIFCTSCYVPFQLNLPSFTDCARNKYQPNSGGATCLGKLNIWHRGFQVEIVYNKSVQFKVITKGSSYFMPYWQGALLPSMTQYSLKYRICSNSRPGLFWNLTLNDMSDMSDKSDMFC